MNCQISPNIRKLFTSRLTDAIQFNVLRVCQIITAIAILQLRKWGLTEVKCSDRVLELVLSNWALSQGLLNSKPYDSPAPFVSMHDPGMLDKLP